jgi:signal transduction histidine kinase
LRWVNLWAGARRELAGYVDHVDRFPRWEMRSGVGTDAERSALMAVRLMGLGAILYSVTVSNRAPGLSGVHVTVTITLCLAALGWLTWTTVDRWPSVTFIAIVVMGLAGGVLAAASPDSGGLVFGAVAALVAGVNTEMSVSLGVTAATLAAFFAGALAIGTSSGTLIGYPATFAGVWAVGMTRRSYAVRAEQAERLLAETRRAGTAEAEAVALAERTRIARDIHDVLAHSLAAVSVNLEAASGLLEPVAGGSAEVTKALECVNRAASLTKEGLADAKRAVETLRVSGPPLPERLSQLTEEFGAAGDAAASLRIIGTSRPIRAEAALALYRGVQEALTNARKHAAGQPVSVELTFTPDTVAVRVTNPAGHAGALSGTGGGYGLTGLAERATAAGGTFEAGRVKGDGGTWRVEMRIPA